MIDALLRALGRFVLGLRYRVRVRGLEEVRRRGTGGVLFLPNHPALIDPILLMTWLHRDFRPRALADKDQIDRPVVRWLARRFNARPILDIARYGDEARRQIASVMDECIAGLKRGENLLIYPSGHLYRTRFEDLRGNSSAESILRAAPQARVVLVRTRGLWGSSFSMISGDFPSLPRVARRALLSLLANFIVFTPRRDVSIEFVEPDDLPRPVEPADGRSHGRGALNEYLERFYNADAPPATYVPYTIWERGGRRALADPQPARPAGRSCDVPAATRAIVEKYLQELTHADALRDEQNLARDLGLDSLARAELMVWLGREFGFHAPDVTALQTVGDVMLAARGEATLSRQAELKPVPARWHRDAGARRAAVPPGETITEVFLRQAARRPDRVIVADGTSGVRTYRDLVAGAFALQPILAALPGERVGIMLPASVAAATTYLATLFAGRTPVLVNWTTGSRNVAHSLELTGVERVITAGPLVARIESQGTDLSWLRARLVHLDALVGRLSSSAKLAAAARGRLSWSALRRVRAPDVAAILLTSGSEALPKAVPLSHANLLANVRDVTAIYRVFESDRLLAFLPPFHSFGLTVTTLLPLLAGIRVAFHANPTEAWMLARLVEAYGATLIAGTPTFLSGILRAGAPKQLASLRLVVTGAEKCPRRTYDLFAERCPRAKVLEGYGVTECSPIVASNREEDPRPGTIGRVLPSLEHAIVDEESRRRVAAGEAGVLLVRGPSVFAGYLGGEAASPFVEFEGRTWYRTGDLVSEDADGVLTFRGRLKRFVKLGGEMISLPAIEGVLEREYARDGDEGPVVAVEATPSEDHPEIVLFTTRDVDRAAANRLLREAQLSALHNVTRVVRLGQIPVLGTGKTDYRALREMLRG